MKQRPAIKVPVPFNPGRAPGVALALGRGDAAAAVARAAGLRSVPTFVTQKSAVQVRAHPELEPTLVRQMTVGGVDPGPRSRARGTWPWSGADSSKPTGANSPRLCPT